MSALSVACILDMHCAAVVAEAIRCPACFGSASSVVQARLLRRHRLGQLAAETGTMPRSATRGLGTTARPSMLNEGMYACIIAFSHAHPL